MFWLDQLPLVLNGTGLIFFEKVYLYLELTDLLL